MENRSEVGLYSKFKVTRMNGDKLDSGSFCLVPFNADGTVRDQAAVTALEAYAKAAGGKVAEGIRDWLANPTKYNKMNTEALS